MATPHTLYENICILLTGQGYGLPPWQGKGTESFLLIMEKIVCITIPNSSTSFAKFGDVIDSEWVSVLFILFMYKTTACSANSEQHWHVFFFTRNSLKEILF